MTDTIFTLVMSFVVVAGFIAFVVLFSLISNLKREIVYLDQKVENRAYDSTVQVLSKTTYETKDKLDALTKHLNVEIKEEIQKYVVEVTK
jgi:short subunit fatty acids transporter